MPSDKRPPLTLACDVCKRRNYVTTKNKTNTRDRLGLAEVLQVVPRPHLAPRNPLIPGAGQANQW